MKLRVINIYSIKSEYILKEYAIYIDCNYFSTINNEYRNHNVRIYSNSFYYCMKNFDEIVDFWKDIFDIIKTRIYFHEFKIYK